MNVAFDAWIPVILKNSEMHEVSLLSVFTEGKNIADLAVQPHERVALMRLFICVAHAALDGPKDLDEWDSVPERLPAAAESYLNKWRDSFELFHKTKPWLQVADLKVMPGDSEQKAWIPISKICFYKASGNNTALFDHSARKSIPKSISKQEIALYLITFQNFFIAGGRASSRVWGDIEIKNPPNPKGGPCAGKSILYSFVRKNDIFDSIHANLSTCDELKLIYASQDNWLGKPIWEIPIISLSDIKAIENATQTHMGRLVPQTRVIKVHKDQNMIMLGSGFDYPKFQDDGTFEPDIFSTVILSRENQERMILSAKPSKSTWRELQSILVKQNTSQGTKNRGPLCLNNMQKDEHFDLVSCALMTDPQKAADIVDITESVYSISRKMTSESGLLTYTDEVKNAEKVGSFLGYAIETWRREIDIAIKERSARGKLIAMATIQYWTLVENSLPLLFSLIEGLGTDAFEDKRAVWHQMLIKSAKDSYSTVCSQETPRQIRAFSLGWNKLMSIYGFLNPKSYESQESG